MKLYHGSEFIIKKPQLGKGNPHNDYGFGFYCTKNIELAKEWSCSEDHDGYANAYNLNTRDLAFLYLNSEDYNILNWLAILLKNREFNLSSQVARDAKTYILKNFLISTNIYDVIVGYRADDSYFSFAQDFLNNTISIRKLSKAMKLGKLGEQVVLISHKAFSELKFTEAIPAQRSKYYVLKEKRDKKANEAYLQMSNKPSYSKDEIYMLDIMRQGVKSDDPRLR